MPNDIFMNLDGLPADSIGTIADRLEARAGMSPFARMRDAYFDALRLPDDARVLELGGGTGIVGRAYARRPGFSGQYVVTDLSQRLIEIGIEKAAADGLSDRMAFRIVDAMTGEGLEGETFDAVVLHTLLSHVPDPAAVMATAARAVRPGGAVAAFDADYASLRINGDDPAVADEVTAILETGAVAQPTVMRRLAAIAVDAGLERRQVLTDLIVEVGGSEFFIGIAEAIGVVLMAQGVLPRELGERWIASLHRALKADTFFGMCPYFTYLFRRP